MKRLCNYLSVALFCMLALCACSNDDDNPFVGTDNFILSWDVVVGDDTYSASIVGNKITLTVPDGTDLSEAKNEVSLCEHATISPDPNTITSWGQEQTFTVTSYAGEKREYIFNIQYSAISTSGTMFLNTQAEVDAFADSGVSVIDGVVYIATTDSKDPVISLNALSKITEITGTLFIGNYYQGDNLEGLNNLQLVGGLEIQNDGELLKTIELKSLRKVGNDLKLTYKIDALSYDKVEFPYLETVYGDILLGTETRIEIASLNLNSLRYVGNTFLFNLTDDVTQIEFPSLEHVVKITTYSTNLNYVSFPQLTSCQSIIFEESKELNINIPKVSELSGELNICPTDYATLLRGLKKIGHLYINYEISSLDLTGIEVETLEFYGRTNSSSCTITNGTDSFHGNLITNVGFPELGNIKYIYGDVTLRKKGDMTIEGIEVIDGVLRLAENLPPQSGQCTGLIAPSLKKLGSLALGDITGWGDKYFNTLICPQLTTYGGDLKFKLDKSFSAGELLELNVDISSLKSFDGSLEITGYFDWWDDSDTDNVTNLDMFKNLESVKSVKISSLKKIKSFSGLEKVASNISSESNWDLTDNAFNPTLADMKAGKTEITDFE